jgi:hypothetical protein
MSDVAYTIGTDRIIWETITEGGGAVITPTSAIAKIVLDGEDIATLTVRSTAGLIQATIHAGEIATEDTYTVEWDIVYTDSNDDVVADTIITNITASLLDSTYLLSLVPRMRVWVNDDPVDITRKIKSDDQLKKYLVEAVRNYITGYTITTTGGITDVDPEPDAESDTEQLIILYGSYLYLGTGIEAIAREQTAMYSVDYDSAYRQIKDRMDMIWDRIVQIDDNAVMPILSESDVESWGQVAERYVDALETWDANS